LTLYRRRDKVCSVHPTGTAKMTFRQLIKLFGSQSAAARAIGIKPHTVCGWQRRGIPQARQYEYQVFTNNLLLAERKK
jgi:hypothetical protein